jgi:hypothetical protein
MTEGQLPQLGLAVVGRVKPSPLHLGGRGDRCGSYPSVKIEDCPIIPEKTETWSDRNTPECTSISPGAKTSLDFRCLRK